VFRKLALYIALLTLASQAFASSILQVGMSELAQRSAFIFEGKVVSKQVRPSPFDGRPCTYFRFDIIDIIKGRHPAPWIELCFTGGTLNGKTLRISDMTMPTVGESGIYFVATLDGEPIHPLFGWQQGHYLIETDAAQVRRVVPAFQRTPLPGNALRENATRIESPPDVQTFKQSIRDQM